MLVALGVMTPRAAAATPLQADVSTACDEQPSFKNDAGLSIRCCKAAGMCVTLDCLPGHPGFCPRRLAYVGRTVMLLTRSLCKCALRSSLVRAATVPARWREMFQPGTDDTIINSISCQLWSGQGHPCCLNKARSCGWVTAGRASLLPHC